MKRLFLAIAALALAGSLAACSKNEATTVEASAPPATPAAAPAAAPAPPKSDMSKMDMSSGAKMAKGAGTVTAVAVNSVTVDHGPIPEVNWPAMTMTFKASPDLARQVKAGDKVAFELKLQDGAGEITAIQKQ
jgi:Cu/Ag efflux protein CusF